VPANIHKTPDSLYVSLAALARAWDCSEATARRRIDRGVVKSVRSDSGVRLVPRSELERIARESAL